METLLFLTNPTTITVIICFVIVFYAIWSLSKLRVLRKPIKNTSCYQSYKMTLINGKTDQNACDYINFDSFAICVGFDTHQASVVSNNLIGLGIFGTFMGLIVGLNGIVLNKINTDATIDSIQSLLSGMNTAFITSVVGMSCSLVYAYCEKKKFGNCNQRLTDFCNQLDKDNFVSPTVMLAHQMGEVAGNRLGESIVRMFEEREGVISETMSQSARNIENASHNFENITTALSNACDKLPMLLEAINKASEELGLTCGDLKDTLETFQETLSPSIQQLQNIMQVQTQNINKQQTIIQQQSEIASQQNAALENIQAITNNLTQTLNGIGDLPTQMRTVYDNIEEQTQQYIHDLNTYTNKLLSNYSTQFTNACEAINNTINAFNAALSANNEITDQIVQSTKTLKQIVENISQYEDKTK